VVSLLTQIGVAKNGVMNGIGIPGAASKAYADAKAQGPKAFADANSLFAKAGTLSATLAKHNVKLDAPKPVTFTALPAKK
jgi:hypothetical protein